jgi:hypothetical protein
VPEKWVAASDQSLPPFVVCKRITGPTRTAFAGRIIKWLDRFGIDDF